jgi:hypothetical protein
MESASINELLHSNSLSDRKSGESDRKLAQLLFTRSAQVSSLLPKIMGDKSDNRSISAGRFCFAYPGKNLSPLFGGSRRSWLPFSPLK